jgi:putative two-component system response regulator
VPEQTLDQLQILIVDDQEQNVHILERLLGGAGFGRLISTTDPFQAVELFTVHRPDLVLLDLHMPRHDGFQVIADISPLIPDGELLPIVVITADDSLSVKKRALSMGAKDFVSKPFDRIEVVLRIRNLLEARRLYLALQAQNDLLEQKVRERTAELERAQKEILQRLRLAAEFRDDDTMQHTERVGDISARVAAELGLPIETVRLLRLAAPLHDLGKIAVPDNILLKYGRLNEGEFALMRAHTITGARLLSGSTHELLQMAEEIALTHHEQWDGSGYDQGLKGTDIPLTSRIVAVADVFDALTHSRPYKPAWTVAEALEEIKRERARRFDPEVVDALVRVVGRGEVDVHDEAWRRPTLTGEES